MKGILITKKKMFNFLWCSLERRAFFRIFSVVNM